jgi:hypothetical protein
MSSMPGQPSDQAKEALELTSRDQFVRVRAEGPLEPTTLAQVPVFTRSAAWLGSQLAGDVNSSGAAISDEGISWLGGLGSRLGGRGSGTAAAAAGWLTDLSS